MAHSLGFNKSTFAETIPTTCCRFSQQKNESLKDALMKRFFELSEKVASDGRRYLLRRVASTVYFTVMVSL